jgi:hypothetical protein
MGVIWLSVWWWIAAINVKVSHYDKFENITGKVIWSLKSTGLSFPSLILKSLMCTVSSREGNRQVVSRLHAELVLTRVKKHTAKIGRRLEIWKSKTHIPSYNFVIVLSTPDYLLLDSVSNLGPFISCREINKFKNYKSVRILEVLKLLFQQSLNLSSSQQDMSGPILGDLSNDRWSGVFLVFKLSCLCRASVIIL